MNSVLKIMASALGLSAWLFCANGHAAPQAANPNSEWRILGNGSEVQHYSPLAGINASNVGKLGIAWSADIPSLDGLVGNPLVADGVVYQSGALGRVFAHDVRTGKEVWRYDPERKLAADVSFAVYWSALYNRGLALHEDLVYVATGDCALIALDRRTGRKVWEAQSCDPKQLYAITAAPRVGAGLVFIGNNCVDSGETRGYVDAFDARSGKRRWRFYTVPGDPKKGFENETMKMAAATWGTDWYAKSHGCGSVWEAMTYDAKSGLLYIGVAGPAPWNPAMRAADASDELFTNSIVALKASTGEYVWHFKQTPHDAWNFDATAQMMIADLPIAGKTRRVLMQAPKNGFFYVLDAATGQFISANNYLPVTWATGVDPKTGRPIVPPSARYWQKSDPTSIVSPGPLGAHNWQAMALNPQTRLVYFGGVVAPTELTVDPESPIGGMRFDMYYGLRGDPKWKTEGHLFAWDPVKQEKRWSVKLPFPMNGGVLATGGNLVFQGQADGQFSAYAADTGKVLWSYNVGTAIIGAPTTVEIDGQQIILVPTGNSGSAASGTYVSRLTSTPMTRGQSRLLAFKLGGTVKLPKPTVKLVPKPPLTRMSDALTQKGRILYEQHFCVACHGIDAESASGKVKDLRMASAETHAMFGGIVIGGLRREQGMPRFADLPPDDLKAIQAFILGEAWAAYDAQQRAAPSPAAKPLHP